MPGFARQVPSARPHEGEFVGAGCLAPKMNCACWTGPSATGDALFGARKWRTFRRPLTEGAGLGVLRPFRRSRCVEFGVSLTWCRDGGRGRHLRPKFSDPSLLCNREVDAGGRCVDAEAGGRRQPRHRKHRLSRRKSESPLTDLNRKPPHYHRETSRVSFLMCPFLCPRGDVQ